MTTGPHQFLRIVRPHSSSGPCTDARRRKSVLSAAPLGELRIIVRFDQVYAPVRMNQTHSKRRSAALAERQCSGAAAGDLRRQRHAAADGRLARRSGLSVQYRAEIACLLRMRPVFPLMRDTLSGERPVSVPGRPAGPLLEACVPRRGRFRAIRPFRGAPARAARFLATDRLESGRPHGPSGRSAPRRIASEELRP